MLLPPAQSAVRLPCHHHHHILPLPVALHGLSPHLHGLSPHLHTAAQLAAGGEAPAVPASLPRQLRELLSSCLDLEPSARPPASALATSVRDIMLLMLAQASRGPGGCRAA